MRRLSTAPVPSDTALQTDKGKLSCLSHSEKPRQLALPLSLDVRDQ